VIRFNVRFPDVQVIQAVLFGKFVKHQKVSICCVHHAAISRTGLACGQIEHTSSSQSTMARTITNSGNTLTELPQCQNNQFRRVLIWLSFCKCMQVSIVDRKSEPIGLEFALSNEPVLCILRCSPFLVTFVIANTCDKCPVSTRTLPRLESRVSPHSGQGATDRRLASASFDAVDRFGKHQRCLSKFTFSSHFRSSTEPGYDSATRCDQTLHNRISLACPDIPAAPSHANVYTSQTRRRRHSRTIEITSLRFVIRGARHTRRPCSNCV
jgi:hypothetical protein